MKKILILLCLTPLLIGCEGFQGEPVKVDVAGTTEGKVKVDKLFTVDGMTVYRFNDFGENVYFTNSTGTVMYKTDDGEGNVTIHRTLCNGKIPAQDPEN